MRVYGLKRFEANSGAWSVREPASGHGSANSKAKHKKILHRQGRRRSKQNISKE